LGEVKPGDLKEGMKVEVVWREEPKGELADIKYFRPVKG
ncbi:MAG: DNA-binding protein, partial [Chloroflexi bacterium]